MITALDLQAAPQIVDGVRPQGAQPYGSSDSGGFGAAFNASLSSSSSSSSSADTVQSGTTETQRSLRQSPAATRNTLVLAQKATVSVANTATSVKLPAKATVSTVLTRGAKESTVDAQSDALGAVTPKTKGALANSSEVTGSNAAAAKTVAPAKAVANDSLLSSQSKDAVAADKASPLAASTLAELQASLVSASRPLSSAAASEVASDVSLKVSATSKASTAGKVSEVAGKSKSTTHDSNAVAGTVTGDALLASLGTSAPVVTLSSVVTTAASTEGSSVEAVSGSKAQIASAAEKPEASATGLSVSGAVAGKNTLAIAWNNRATTISSAGNVVTPGEASVAASPELLNTSGVSGSPFGIAATPPTGGGLSSGDRLATPPIHWPTSPPVATDVSLNSEAAKSSPSAALPTVTGADLQTNTLTADLFPASSANATVPVASIATDTPASSLPAKTATASVEPVASRSLTSAGPVKIASAGVLPSATVATNGVVQSGLPQTPAIVATSTPSGPADTKAAQTENQPRAVAEVSVAATSGAANIKQAVLPKEQTSSSHPAVTTAGTASGSSPRGSLDSSSASPDRGAGSDAASNAVTIHGDISTSAALPHSVQSPAVDLASSASVSVANLTATVVHPGSTGPTDLSTPTTAGTIGASAVQAAGTDALHGAGATSGVISSESHQTLAATPTSLEVGVHSGTQGWLKIRAEVGDQGTVTASLAATSTSGQQSLKGQLPALNAYLQSEQMSVTTSVAERIGGTHVAVAHETALGSSATGAGSAGGGSAGQDTSLLQSGAGQGAFGQGGGQQGSGLPTSSVAAIAERDEAGQSYAGRAESIGTASTSTALDGSGRWLNVRV